MTIGKTIQQLREEQNLLQSDLAAALNLGRTTISNYENDYSSPDLQTLINIANLFNVSTDYLLGISENRVYECDLTNQEKRLLYYFKRLNWENRDYIIGEMIKLYREQPKSTTPPKN